MRFIRPIVAITLTAFFFVGIASAADYMVQIGALDKPSPIFAEPASGIGKVETSQNRSGLTRYRVGRYATEGEAQNVMQKLKAVGYTDAYVLRVGPTSKRSSRSVANKSETKPALGVQSQSSAREPVPSDLPEELVGRVVYLDGKLHIKEDGRFVPLRDYRDRTPAVSAGPQ